MPAMYPQFCVFFARDYCEHRIVRKRKLGVGWLKCLQQQLRRLGRFIHSGLRVFLAADRASPLDRRNKDKARWSGQFVNLIVERSKEDAGFQFAILGKQVFFGGMDLEARSLSKKREKKKKQRKMSHRKKNELKE